MYRYAERLGESLGLRVARLRRCGAAGRGEFARGWSWGHGERARRPHRNSSTGSRRRALAVCDGGALSHFENVTVRIADVAANLAVLGNRLGDELGSTAFP